MLVTLLSFSYCPIFILPIKFLLSMCFGKSFFFIIVNLTSILCCFGLLSLVHNFHMLGTLAYLVKDLVPNLLRSYVTL